MPTEDFQFFLSSAASYDCQSGRAEILDRSGREGEDYQAFVRRAAANPIDRKVKLADLLDKMDLSRLEHLTEKELARVQKYHAALSLLTRHPDE